MKYSYTGRSPQFPQISNSGELSYTTPVTLPISTPRINATITPKGIKNISIWGQGPMGNIYFSPPKALTPNSNSSDRLSYTLQPNIFNLKNANGTLSIYALRELPAFIIENKGFLKNLHLHMSPYRKKLAGLENKTMKEITTHTVLYKLPQGTMVIAKIKHNLKKLFIISAGEYREAKQTIEEVVQNPKRYIESAKSYTSWLTSRFISDDSLLNSLFIHCLHSALSSYKEDSSKKFAGLSAGPGYSLPARTYYRDSYWTAQTLLPFKPHWVREEIKILMRGIKENGEAPSGVIIPTPIGKRYWERQLSLDPSLKIRHTNPEDWWSDHFDSPLFFVLMVFDYCYWTDDYTILKEKIQGKTVWKAVLTIINRYRSLPHYQSLLLKPNNDRDWADNVFRSGMVTYDNALYYRALVVTAKWAKRINPELSSKLWALSLKVKKNMLSLLWLKHKGYFMEYIAADSDLRETHLNLDTLIATRFGITNRAQTRQMLNQVAKILETRNNNKQPYGDWGIMCTYPPYSNKKTLWGKTSFPYRYHNGSDWPYLDGVYADLLLYYGMENWKYPLTRWWEYSLSQGWTEPVEYYSPPWGRGGLLQAWSSMPASAIISGGFGLHPERKLRIPPWGDSSLKGITFQSKPLSLHVWGGKIKILPLD